MKTCAIAAAILLGIAVPAKSEVLPQWSDMLQHDNRRAVTRLQSIIARRSSSKDGLAELDRLLATVPDRTRVRGLVQFFRAGCLMILDRHPEAVEAIDEAIMLMPGYSLPHVLASQLHAYSDRPDRAADHLLTATAIDREIVEHIEDYDIAGLLSRLDEQGNRQKLLAVSERLIETEWSKGKSATRSRMAMAVIEQRLARDADRAGAMLQHVSRPSDVYKILTEERFTPLRSAAIALAGERLDRLWVAHLDEERGRWERSGDGEDGISYARALLRAGQERKLVATFLPVIADDVEAPDAAFLITFVGDGLARLGRWDEVDALYAKATTAWPLGKQANAINVAANRGRLLVMRGKHAEGLAQIDAALADASAWGGEVNSGAVGALHFYRACALGQLGRKGEAAGSLAYVANRRRVDVRDYVDLLLCMDDPETARAALLEGLDQEPARAQVVAWMQPADFVFDSDFARSVTGRADQLRQDPKLRRAVSRHGRLLDWSVSAGAPADAD